MNPRPDQRSPLSRPLLQTSSIDGGRESDYDDHDVVHLSHPEDGDVEEDISTILQDDNNRLLVRSLFGRAYAVRWNFWWQHLPSSAILGSAVGVIVPIFLWTTQKVRGILFTRGWGVHYDWGNSNEYGDNDYYTAVGSSNDHKHWWWLMWTIGGSVLSSIVLQFPMAPKPETVRTVLAHVAYLEGSVVESLYTVLSSWIALTCGAPIGVDLAVSAIGSGLADVIVMSFFVDERSRALYVQAGIAAAFSILLPSPLLGLLLVQELRIATRPDALTVSSVVSKRARMGRGGTSGLSRTQQDEGGQKFGENDLLEQITIEGVAMVASAATISAIVPSQWQSILFLRPPHLEGREFEYLDWLLAVPLGILGGVTVIIAGAVYLKWTWFRCRSCQYFHTKGWMSSIVRQMFVVLAGLVFGMLGIIWSQPPLFENGVNAWQGTVEAYFNGISPFEAIHFGLHVIIGVAICLGCGVLGGPVFPMMVVGACLGVSMPSSIAPLNVSLPCCMAATLGAFIPAPFTVISTISLLFGLDSNQTISVFIATMVACACSGGMGGLRCMGEYVWGIPHLHDEAAQHTVSPGHEEETIAMDEEEANSERPPSDFEILQGIRSALFGSPSPN